MILSLWSNIAAFEGQLIMASTEEMPIISTKNRNVSSHYGISLSSTPSTTIVVDASIPEAQMMKTWRASNLKSIGETLVEVEFIIKKPQASPRMITKFHTVADAVRLENVYRFSLKVKAQVSNERQKFYYMACDK